MFFSKSIWKKSFNLNMMHINEIVAVLLALIIPLCAHADFTGLVVSVKDGDTIGVMNDGDIVTVRLYGIDCPEKGQPFGKAAKIFTSNAVFNRNVKIIERGKDRWRRTVGDVLLDDGAVINRELVRFGLAWWYKKYSKDDIILERLESQARISKIGLWSDSNPVPPWDWRRKDTQPPGGVW